MTQMPSPAALPPRAGTPSNIYTVLLLCALLILAVGIGYIWWRSSQLYGDNPFSVPAAATQALPRR